MTKFRFIIACMVIFTNPIASNCQTKIESVEKKNYGCWNVIDATINDYADSLNFYSAHLPSFVYDYHLDHLLLGFSRNCFITNQLLSYRRAILQRVINEESLIAIIKSPDSRLDMLYNPKKLEEEKKNYPSIHGSNYPELPYMKYSTRQLAEKRLKELRKVKGSLR